MPQFAVRGDGKIVITEPTNAGLPPVMVADTKTGFAATYNIPASSFTDPSQVVHNDYSLMGPPIVDSDGSAYMEYQVRQLAYPPKVTSSVIYLLKIGMDDSTVTTQLMSNAQLNTSQYPEPTDSSLMPGRIIPDGQGGVLAQQELGILGLTVRTGARAWGTGCVISAALTRSPPTSSNVLPVSRVSPECWFSHCGFLELVGNCSCIC